MSKLKMRDVEMFKDWMSGMSMEKVAEKYELSVPMIYKIKKRDNWNDLKAQIRDKMYQSMLEDLKSFSVELTQALKKDFMIIQKKLNDETPQPLTPEERSHIRLLMDRVLKENRLSDGKPTEVTNTSGEVVHRIILPPGAKRFGIIPPPANVKVIESEVKPDNTSPESLSLEDVIDDNS